MAKYFRWIEFNEVEIYSNGKVETYLNDELLETAIGSLKMNQGSNIEIHNVSFNDSISCLSGSKMKIEGKAKFSDKISITLTDSSFC